MIRLLIVDDEAELNLALCQTLTEQDYEVVGCASGPEALQQLRKQNFDLLITDLMMPQMDGIELLRAALEIDPHLVSIVMTGHGTVQTAVGAMKAGAFDYILKPFKLQTLLPILTRALEVRRLRLENVQLRETVVIHEFNQTLASTLDLDTILNKVADAALQQLQADEASIMLPNAAGDAFEVTIVRGVGREHIAGRKVPLEGGIAGWVAQHREPLTLHGEIKDERFISLATRLDIVSSVSMPMLAGGKFVGVLNVNATIRRRPFSAGEVKALAILASSTAYAIEGARLYQEAREAEEKYRSIFENAVEGIFQITPNGRYLATNPAMARLLGYDSPEDLLAHVSSTEDLYVDIADRDRLRHLLATQGAIYGYEYQVYRKDGSVMQASVSAQAVRDENGVLLRYEGTVEDITARRQAEAALETMFDQLQSLFESLDDVFFSVDVVNNELLQISQACEVVYGYPRQAFYDDMQLWQKVVHPDDKAFVQAKHEELNAGRSITVEHRIIRADNEVRWVESRIKPRQDESGQVVRIDGVIADITLRKNADKELRHSQQALQSVNDQLELRVQQRTAELGEANEVLRANEARLLEGNRAFNELARLRVTSQQELESALHQITESCCNTLDMERCSLWLFNDDHSVLRCIDLFLRTPGQHSQGMELVASDYPRYFQALQSTHIIAVTEARNHPATQEFSSSYLIPLGITSMLDTAIVIGGQLVGVLCCEALGAPRNWKVEEQTFATSATAICSLALESYERACAEEKSRQAKEEADVAREAAEMALEEAERANHAKSEFLSRMSHELRTPLNAILGFGQILKMQPLNPLQSEGVGHIMKAGHHLLELINEVLDIARIEAGHLELSVEPVVVGDVVRESIDMVRPLALQHEIAFEGEEALPTCNYVMADRHRLKQVLINLFSNAIKYNQPTGHVSVRCEEMAGQQTFIHIEDTGIGIAPEDLEKMFTPFERLQAAQSAIEGTGLGLPLSRRLLEAMQGSLGVSSVPGQGSTFSIKLPSAQSPLASMTQMAEENLAPTATPLAAKQKLVLSIEDNISNFRLIEAIIEYRPHLRLINATEGEMGLEAIRQYRPDLILLDLHLPDIPGLEVLRRLRLNSDFKSVPVVVLSADATSTQIARLLSAGADDYLTKPINVHEFLRVLDTFTNQSNS